MNQPDKSHSSTSRRLKRARGAEPKPRASEGVAPRPVIPNPEVDSRTDIQVLHRQLSEMTFKLGGLEEQLKRSREAQSRSDAAAAASERRAQDVSFKASRVPTLEMEIAALRPQLEEARRRVKELQADAKKGRLEREQLQADHRNAVIRAAELEHRVEGLSAGASRAGNLEQKSEELRVSLEETTRALEEARQLAAEVTLDRSRQIEAAAAQTAELKKHQESLEQEIVQARKAEAQARAEAVACKASEERLNDEVTRLKGNCQEQRQTLDRLERKAKDLEEILAKTESFPPSSATLREDPLGVFPAESSPLSDPPSLPPLPASGGGTTASDPIEHATPTEAPLLPPPTPIPIAFDPLSAPHSPEAPPVRETTLRMQNLFGSDGEDGQPRYVLEDILSKDALGIVYRATERSTARKFVVRFMAGQAGEEQTQAIERGVEKLIALPHPNILHIQGSGRRKNRLYLMMDLVDGPTLGESNIQEVMRICAIVRDSAAAVHYANEECIFHGDLNPENILVTQMDGRDHPLVKEFGLGFLQEIMMPPTSGKEATPVLRNPAFLPPEQVRSMKSPLSAAGDVYGLGATLYAALSGRPPFEGKDPAKVAKRVMIEEPIPIEKVRLDVPEAVGAIIRRSMAKERGLRYASAQDMADALTRILVGPTS